MCKLSLRTILCAGHSSLEFHSKNQCMDYLRSSWLPGVSQTNLLLATWSQVQGNFFTLLSIQVKPVDCSDSSRELPQNSACISSCLSCTKVSLCQRRPLPSWEARNYPKSRAGAGHTSSSLCTSGACPYNQVTPPTFYTQSSYCSREKGKVEATQASLRSVVTPSAICSRIKQNTQGDTDLLPLNKWSHMYLGQEMA